MHSFSEALILNAIWLRFVPLFSSRRRITELKPATRMRQSKTLLKLQTPLLFVNHPHQLILRFPEQLHEILIKQKQKKKKNTLCLRPTCTNSYFELPTTNSYFELPTTNSSIGAIRRIIHGLAGKSLVFQNMDSPVYPRELIDRKNYLGLRTSPLFFGQCLR